MGDSIDKTLPTRASTPSEAGAEVHPVPELFRERYRIGDVIGTGGFGVVYSAVDEHLEKGVAVKVLRGGRSRDARSLERFRNEALTTGQLNHPNIVAVTDFGVLDDGRPYLVMELVGGESLSDVLRRERKLSICEAARVARALCAGLTAAHERGIIHRDLKPDNIIVQGDDEASRVIKIVDFGIAKLTQADLLTDSTETSGLIGTPTYMAPEQIRQSEHLDGRADVYALGVILFKMLTGKTPFSGRPAGDLMIAKATEKPPRPRHLNDQIPPALDRIVVRAIQPDPEVRTATAADLFDALAPFTSEHVVVRRAPRWLVPAVGAALVAGAAATYLVVRGGKPPKETERVQPTPVVPQLLIPGGTSVPAPSRRWPTPAVAPETPPDAAAAQAVAPAPTVVPPAAALPADEDPTRAPATKTSRPAARTARPAARTGRTPARTGPRKTTPTPSTTKPADTPTADRPKGDLLYGE